MKSPFNILPNTKVKGSVPAKDIPVGNDKKLPDWVKMVIGCDIIMVHLVIILVGVESIPFTLNDTTLAAYIVIGLGMPVGLANQTIRSALAAYFVKS